MNDVTKKFVKVSLWIAVLLFIIRSIIGWGELTSLKDEEEFVKLVYVVLSYAGEAMAISAILMAVFNKWGWKWKPLNAITGKMPVLSKKYVGILRFKYKDHEGNVNVEVTIQQTFLNISVIMRTEESSSYSLAAIIKEENGTKTLFYNYLNTPRGDIQDRSSIHYGTAMIDLENQKHLTGNYYTSRLSCGFIELNGVD